VLPNNSAILLLGLRELPSDDVRVASASLENSSLHDASSCSTCLSDITSTSPARMICVIDSLGTPNSFAMLLTRLVYVLRFSSISLNSWLFVPSLLLCLTNITVASAVCTMSVNLVSHHLLWLYSMLEQQVTHTGISRCQRQIRCCGGDSGGGGEINGIPVAMPARCMQRQSVHCCMIGWCKSLAYM
jgi:hypothetical protein